MKRRGDTGDDSSHDPSAAASVQKPWRRRRWIIGGCAAAFAVALAVSGVLASESSDSSLIREDTPHAAPAFALPLLLEPQRERTLRKFRGRPVVVNFWASWCVPCRKEMPALQHVYRQVRGRIAFVGVDHQDTRAAAVAFVRHTGVRYPIAFDPDGTTAKSYGLVGVPTTVFIDARGREVARHLGKISRRDLDSLLRQLFPHAITRP